MVKLLIIADDFTGALDTGVQFAKQGIKTLVSIQSEYNALSVEDGAQILVIDTESRHIGAEEAYRTVFKIAGAAGLSGIKKIYKKTDSTLRGNIGSELEAVMNALGENTLVFIPAFPMAGRVTVDGFQYVNGEALHKTAFAHDPLDPVVDSYIPDIIGKQTEADVVIVRKGELQDFGDQSPKQKTMFVFDCEKDEDFKRIGRVLKQTGRMRVTAGSAGFAAFLPELLELKGHGEAVAEEFEKKCSEELLVVCGSLNERSLKQINFGEMHGYSSITLTEKEKLTEDYFESPDGLALVEKAERQAVGNGKLIIKAAGSRQEEGKCLAYARSIGLDEKSIPFQIACNIGKLVKQVIDRSGIGTLIVFGGDTAVSIMNALGCDGIIPVREIVPGVAVSKVAGNGYNLKLITKAGGFGDESVLLDIEQYLNVNRQLFTGV